ncbi:MAG: desulforedoxin [Chloroflexi bacterium]|nr:desulforedoxin [Chloroflexota bacterium]
MAGVKREGEEYICDICNNKVIVTKAGGGALVCCGVPMRQELNKDEDF